MIIPLGWGRGGGRDVGVCRARCRVNSYAVGSLVLKSFHRDLRFRMIHFDLTGVYTSRWCVRRFMRDVERGWVQDFLDVESGDEFRRDFVHQF